MVGLISCDQSDNGATFEIRTDNPLSTELDVLVDESFRSYAAKTQTAGFSLAVLSGEDVHYYNYGRTIISNDRLPDNQTLYEIGSITKTFTSATLLHWLNDRDIDVNNPLSPYLPPGLSPHLSSGGAHVTFKHILNHSSGLPRIPDDLPNNNDPYNGYDSVSVYTYIMNNDLLRTPGTVPSSLEEAPFFYSNTAYGVAGLTLERQLNQSLHQIIETTILQPLGMERTTMEDVEGMPNIAYPHDASGETAFWHFDGLAGAGALKSTASDMARYAKAQLQRDSSSTLGHAFLTSQTPTVQVNDQDLFGMGWEYYYLPAGDKKILVKDGGTGGFTAFLLIDPATQKALAALFNNELTNDPATPTILFVDRFFAD